MADDSELLLCAMCGDAANQRCTGCYVTFYCCKEHQKMHWKKHKNVCCAYKIGTSAELGRYLYATRDLKPGELILMEAPIVLAPVLTNACVSCNEPSELKHRCNHCGWFLCSSRCEESKKHRPECSLIQKAGKVKKLKKDDLAKLEAFHELIPVMRGLYLKGTKIEKYQFILGLDAHGEHRRKSGRDERDKMVLQILRKVIGLSKMDFPDQEIMSLCGVLFINAHEVPVSATPTVGLYETVSYLEHNCVNNGSKHFDMNSTVFIRAAVPIKKGEHISISYSDPMWGTRNRKHHLMETKYFECQCARCLDPSEFGTHFSSIRCHNCSGQQKGYLTPITTQLMSQAQAAMPTQWQCNMCMEKQDEAYVSSVITAIGEELVKLEKGSEETCKSFIIKHSQNLHPNHFYLMDVKLALCQMLGKGGPEKNGGGAGGGGGGVEHAKEKELVLKQKLCMEILDVVNKISPGISRLRGVVLYELQSTLSIYARRKFNRGEISLQHLKNIMQEVVNYLKECIQIFSYEPSCLQEGRLTAIARLDLVEAETFIDSIGTAPGATAETTDPKESK